MLRIRSHSAWFVSLAVFLILAGLFVSVWKANRGHQHSALRAQAEKLAELTARQLEDSIRARLTLAKQLRIEWEIHPFPNRRSFERRALALMQQISGYQALNWIDSKGVIQWTVPRGPNIKAEGHDLHQHPFARETFMRAEATKSDQVTPIIELLQGGLGLASYLPIESNGQDLGYLNAVFRIDPLVNEVLPEAVRTRFPIHIEAGGRRIFSNHLQPLSDWTAHPQPATLKVGETTWTVQVMVGREAVSQGNGGSSSLLLVVGIGLSALIAVLVWLAIRFVHRLQQSERRYRELFEESLDAVYISTPEGRLLDINQAGVQMFEATNIEQLLSVDIGAELFVDPIERDQLVKALEREGSVQGYLLHLRRLDGEDLWVRATATTVRDERGEIVQLRGILHDETNVHRMQQELIKIQRIEGMSQLAGGVAHDFNNVLAAIMSNISLLRLKIQDADQGQYLERIERSVDSASQLTRQLLEFSRGTLSSTGPVELNPLVETALVIVERSIDSSITIECHLEDALPPVQGDAGRLQQVLLNLLLNARDAMPDGGTLTVSTSLVPSPPDLPDESCEGTSSCIRLAVVDTGLGMTPETASRIFEPFFTTKGRSKGTGLGLAVVYGIVRDHGGTIRVQSAPNKGSRFEVLLPPATEDAPPGVEPDESSLNRPPTVLVVDDDSDIRGGVREILTEKGYAVVEASKPAEALSLIRERAEDIDLVLLDMTMPGPSGLETMNKLREVRPDVSVVLSSGFGVGVWKPEFGGKPPDAVLPKPYSITTLLETIATVLNAVPRGEV